VDSLGVAPVSKGQRCTAVIVPSPGTKELEETFAIRPIMRWPPSGRTALTRCPRVTMRLLASPALRFRRQRTEEHRTRLKIYRSPPCGASPARRSRQPPITGIGMGRGRGFPPSWPISRPTRCAAMVRAVIRCRRESTRDAVVRAQGSAVCVEQQARKKGACRSTGGRRCASSALPPRYDWGTSRRRRQQPAMRVRSQMVTVRLAELANRIGSESGGVEDDRHRRPTHFSIWSRSHSDVRLFCAFEHQ